jgi:hypothetical protein
MCIMVCVNHRFWQRCVELCALVGAWETAIGNNLAAGLPTHRIARTPSLAGILAVVPRPLPTVEQSLRRIKDLFSAFCAEKELAHAEIICEYIRKICGE